MLCLSIRLELAQQLKPKSFVIACAGFVKYSAMCAKRKLKDGFFVTSIRTGFTLHRVCATPTLSTLIFTLGMPFKHPIQAQRVAPVVTTSSTKST